MKLLNFCALTLAFMIPAASISYPRYYTCRPSYSTYCYTCDKKCHCSSCKPAHYSYYYCNYCHDSYYGCPECESSLGKAFAVGGVIVLASIIIDAILHSSNR